MNRRHSAVSLLSIVVGLGFLVVYLLTTNQIFSFDAITNAIACETNEPIRWFHSNHPLYPFLGVVWYRVERFFGFTGYSVYSLARLNSLLMASALALCAFSLGKRLKMFPMVAVFLGTTFGVWNYAVDGRAIGASVFFSAVVISYLLRIGEQEEISAAEAALLGIFSSVTILVHGMNVFHLFPIVVWLRTAKKNKKASFVYLATVVGVVGFVYTALYLIVVRPGTGGTLLDWALGYAGYGGSRNALNSQFWADSAQTVLRGAWFGWVHVFFTPSSSRFVEGISIAGTLFMLVMVGTAFYRIKFLEREQRSLALLLVFWGVLDGLFLLFWSPGQEGFRLHVLVPWIVVVGLSLRSRLVNWMFAGLSVLFFYVNFTFGIFPAAFIQNNVGYQSLRTIRDRIHRGDVVLTGESGVIPGIEVMLPYFFPDLAGGTIDGRLMAFRERDLGPLLSHLEQKSRAGFRIYFTDDIMSPNTQRRIEQHRGLRTGEVQNFVRHFRVADGFDLPSGARVLRMEVLAG